MPRWHAWGVAALAALLIGAAGAAAAQTAALPPAEMFFKPAEFIEAKLSPSGRRLAITSSVRGTRIGLYTLDLENGARPVGGVQYDDGDVHEFHWVGDDRLVLTLIDRQSGSGEQDAPGLFSVRWDGQQPRQLVARRGQSGFAPGEFRPPLPWFHRLLHVPADGSGEVIVGEMRWNNRQELADLVPMRLNVATGRTRSVEFDAPPNITRWLFDSRGEARVGIDYQRGRQKVHARAPGQAAWRLLDDSEQLRVPFIPRFVDDAGQLFVERVEGRARTAALFRFELASGRPDPSPLIRVPGFDVAGSPVSDGASGRLVGWRVLTDAESTAWFDPALKVLQAQADQRFPGYATRLHCARCSAPDRVVLVHAWSARDPGHLWLSRGDGGKWELVSRMRPGIEPRRMADVAFERIKARDGRELPLWLTIPPGREPVRGAGGPAVVLVHGGPWARGSRWQWSGLEQFLASRGYVVISPEFRGSMGFGADHAEAGYRQWGRTMQHDVADAARWAVEQGWAGRLCIAGAGYGGYATLMGLVNDADLFQCGVAWLAIADPLLFLQGSWWTRDILSDSWRRYNLPEMVGDADKDAEMLKAASPVEQAARIRRPLLLAYGGSDLVVPLEHGQRLRRAMQAAGREPEWQVYDEEGHGWLRLANQLDFAARLERFLGQHLK